MAGLWPSSTSPHSTGNFDSDADTVTGTNGARVDLYNLIAKFNTILNALPPSAYVFSNLTPGTIAFKDAANVYTNINTYQQPIRVSADNVGGDKAYYQFYNAGGSRLWDILVNTVNVLYFRNAAGAVKFIIRQDCKVLDLTSTGLLVDGYPVQMVPITLLWTNVTFNTSNLSAGNIYHNKGTPPTLIDVQLRCITAEYGYVPGYTVRIDSSLVTFSTSGPANAGIVIYDSSANVLSWKVSAGSIALMALTTGTYFHVNPDNWKLDFKMYWF